MNVPHPVLKSAGGKSWAVPALLDIIDGQFPNGERRIGTYVEPFAGGAALFWALRGRFAKAVLNDANPEIANVYKVLRDERKELGKVLRNLEVAYELEPEAFYYRERALEPASLGDVRRAARTILLNKTSFNGLYRVNRLGRFNVPWGKRLKVNTFDQENFDACEDALRSVAILNVDFRTLFVEFDDLGRGDVVYFDPPYLPTSETANFTTYTAGGFLDADQENLADLARQLVKDGVLVIASNADVPRARELWKGFEIRSVEARRAINVKGDSRGKVGEILAIGRPS